MANALVALVARHMAARPTDEPYVTPVPGLILLRAHHAKIPAHLVFKPSLCLALQGAKSAVVGDRRLVYGPGRALVVSVRMPVCSRVTEASPDKPYLGIVLELDLGIMAEVVNMLPAREANDVPVNAAVQVSGFAGPLAASTRRLLALLDTPKAIPALYPSIMREICYWLLTGVSGPDIARVALGTPHARGLVTAIHALRDRFAESISVAELAQIAQMSPSAFHRQFKAVTSWTPLQYQKQLRLLEARRLLAAGEATAEMAAFLVGYESPSQFNREYARMFGAPPRRDAAKLRTVAA
jgi:AraC-like DNA-binding protein